MFLTPYDTTIESKVVLTKTIHALQLAKAEGRLEQAIENVPNIFAVVGKGPGIDQIPAFGHALAVDELVFVDLRGFGSAVFYGGQYNRPTDGIPSVLLKQALLQTAWQSDTQARRELYHLSDLPAQIYASWLSELITRRLALDETTQMKLAALSAWFFMCLFLTEDEFSAHVERGGNAAVKISRLLRLPLELVQQVSESGYLKDSQAFTDAVKQLGSLKLENFNLGVLHAITAGSWFGPKPTIAVALEHPPTFIAVVHTVVNERGFQKTSIGMSAQRFLKGSVLEQFNHSFIATIRRLED